MSKKLEATERRRQLLDAAIWLAERQGYQNITRAQIAARCKVSEALPSVHFGTMRELRRALVIHAVDTKNMRVLLQAVVNQDPLVRKMADDLRNEVNAHITAR